MQNVSSSVVLAKAGMLMESTMTADNKILNIFLIIKLLSLIVYALINAIVSWIYIQNKKRIAPITFLYGLCANPVDF